MTPEALLQGDLFTGELLDARSRRQKQADRRLAQPAQGELFPACDVAQFGVDPRPLLPLGPDNTLRLVSEDPRTPAEQEREVEQEARERTYQLFDEHLESTEETLPIRVETLTDQEGITRHYIFDGDELVVMTAGAMPCQADELAAQRQIAERIVTALSARPADKDTTG